MYINNKKDKTSTKAMATLRWNDHSNHRDLLAEFYQSNKYYLTEQMKDAISDAIECLDFADKAQTIEGLKNFDTKTYKRPEGTRSPWKKGSSREGREMGEISNLITDMTLQGASPEELARAVRHSMVIIDTGKHNLDYKQSFNDNNISELRKKYQNGGGAITSYAIETWMSYHDN